ncbi:hypothetical protein M3650_10130 [Paenibacillus sp. MER TA 81-3]|uniref:hypothetical protein n=1 Tax=Paenibacillus sp. MER TA 81-3 TaxID=2939573 RepID=UPI00204026C2|nr:hypothetical protein [Paenibacillus sp. MER TA 81-3]MCM3338980.1 hypothetical protein [Paenibacillus sp. MER TA 81-3]
MDVCNRCGEKLDEHEPHTCSKEAALSGTSDQKESAVRQDIASHRETAAAAGAMDASAPYAAPGQVPNQPLNANGSNSYGGASFGVKRESAFDMKRAVQLMKHPTEASALQPASDWLYGVIAVAASAIGFALFAFSIFSGLMSMLNPFGAYLNAGESIGLFIKLVLLYIITLAALFGALWLVSRWKGVQRSDVKTFLVRLAAMQMPYGPAYLVAFLMMLISFTSLSLAIAGIVWFTSVIMTVSETMEQAEVTRDNRFLCVASSIALYFVLLLILTKIFL